MRLQRQTCGPLPVKQTHILLLHRLPTASLQAVPARQFPHTIAHAQALRLPAYSAAAAARRRDDVSTLHRCEHPGSWFNAHGPQKPSVMCPYFVMLGSCCGMLTFNLSSTDKGPLAKRSGRCEHGQLHDKLCSGRQSGNLQLLHQLHHDFLQSAVAS